MMKKKFNEDFFGSDVLLGLYHAYHGDESWKKYAKTVLDEELKREPGLFDKMECPEGVPEDICKIAFAAGGNEYFNARLGLFDGYTVLEILKHCKHGEIIVRAGLQRLHW